MSDSNIDKFASQFAKDCVNQALLSFLLSISTEKDKDQEKSINLLMDSISAQIK